MAKLTSLTLAKLTPTLALKSIFCELCSTTWPPEPPPEPPPTRFKKMVFSPPPPTPPRASSWPLAPNTIGPSAMICTEPPPPAPPEPFSSPAGFQGPGKLPDTTRDASPPAPPPEPAQGFASSPTTTVLVCRLNWLPKKLLLGLGSPKGEGAMAPPRAGPAPVMALFVASALLKPGSAS